MKAELQSPKTRPTAVMVLALVGCLAVACAEPNGRNPAQNDTEDRTADAGDVDPADTVDGGDASPDPLDDAAPDRAAPNVAPTCAITAPLEGAVAPDSAPLRLVGQVGDDRDAPSELTVSWRSDADGRLGEAVAADDGAVSLDVTLDLGTHRIELSVIDRGGLSCAASVSVTVGHDGDLDGHVGLSDGGDDCDDGAPQTHPGAAEICDGVANDCLGPPDDGVISDGAGCQDPGPPSFPDAIDVLHVTLRTADGASAGTDANAISVCLSSDRCFTLNNPNYNDFEESATDVFSFEAVGLARSEVDRIEIRSSGGDAWTPACLSLRFDGEPVYCNAAIGETFTNTTWQDPAGLTAACTTCFDETLTHGPMVGATGSDWSRLWLRTDATRPVRLRVSDDLASLDGAEPVAFRYPSATADLTAIIDLVGLLADTTYHYEIEVDGTRFPSHSFRTSPEAGPVEMSLAFGSCSKWDGQPIFAEIDALSTDLFLFVGDNHYGNTNDLSDLRQYYRWALEVPERAALARHTPTVAVWDDHDFVGNNTTGAAPGRERALRAFSEYWANPSYGTDEVPGVFFTHRYGDVELFAVDDRYWRALEDSILGLGQTRWLEEALLESDATFKLVASGSQWTTEGSDDSWAFFPEAQQSLLQFIADHGIEGVVLLSGDVHRSELRLLPGGRGGYSIPELVSSPLANSNSGCSSSNELLGCWDDGRFVVTATIDTTLDDPSLTATVLDESGSVLRSWEIRASALRNPAWVPVPAEARRDVDGDGYADLLVGVPGEADDAGAVHLLRGSSLGLQTLGSARWSQDSAGVPGASESGDAMGAAIALGDFDGDGHADAAIGSPGEAIGSESAAGMVTIFPGTPGGLDGSTAFNLHQNTSGVAGEAQADDLFGHALAVGDFDDDGFDDLAVGAPGEAVDTGVIYVFAGSGDGLDPAASVVWDQSTTGAPTSPEQGDDFGAALTSGDFNGDGIDDLAIGAPGEAIGEVAESGHVTVLYGTSEGLSDAATQSFHQGSDGIAGAVEAGDRWGEALVAGDFDDDGHEDLVVGSPDEALGGADAAGRISVLCGSPSGLEATGSQSWQLDNVGPGSTGGDRFGHALTAGDLNGDRYDDLAVGVPGRAVGGDARAGAVIVLLGQEVGLSATYTQLDQDDSRWMGAEPGDRFGSALSAGDYNADRFTDLAVGTPDEDLTGRSNAGAVLVFFGSASGPVRATDQRWHENLRRVADTIEAQDRFGAAMPR